MQDIQMKNVAQGENSAFWATCQACSPGIRSIQQLSLVTDLCMHSYETSHTAGPEPQTTYMS